MSVVPYVLVHLLFLSQLDVHLAKESIPHRGCWFSCGNLGEVGPPFSITTNPKCGVFVINCTEPKPTIQFKKEGKWYPINQLNYFEGTIEIHDEKVQTNLVSNRCELLQNTTEQAFLRKFDQRLQPFLSFDITETRPFFKCKHQPINRYQFFTKFHNYTSCNDYVLYYYDDKEWKLPSLPRNLSNLCSVVDLPSATQEDSVKSGNDKLTLHWASNFTIHWKVLPDCLECFEGGGQCKSDPNKHFLCRKLKGTNVRRKILVGAGVAGVILTCIASIIYYRYQRNKPASTPNPISRSLSRDDSLNSEIENVSVYFRTPIFSHKELDESTNHFDESKKLGDGGFGTVYHGELRDGRVVAVKRLFENSYKRVEQFMNEIEILSLLRHQNLSLFTVAAPAVVVNFSLSMNMSQMEP